MEEGPQGGLRDVFSACDEDGDGWVDVEHFVRLAASHLPSEREAVALGRLLDPKGLGLIDFDAFCRGVSAFGGGGTAHLTAEERGDDHDDCRRDGHNGGLGSDWDEVGEVTDSAYLGSESAPSETETLPDEETCVAGPGRHQEGQQWENDDGHLSDDALRPGQGGKAGAAPRSTAELGDTLGYLQMGNGSTSSSPAIIGPPGAGDSSSLRGDEPRDEGVSTPPGSGGELGAGSSGGGGSPRRRAQDAGYLSGVSPVAVDGRCDFPDGLGVRTNASLPSDGSRWTEPTGRSDNLQRDTRGDLGDGSTEFESRPGHRDDAGAESNPAANGAEEFEECGGGEEPTAVEWPPRRHNLSASDTWSLQAPSYESRFSTSSPAGGLSPGGRRGEATGDDEDTSYCLCCRQRIAQLRELDRRLTQLHLTGPRRRISTKAFARRLLPGGHKKSASCSNKEDFFAESPDTGGEVNQRMSLLENKVLELESDSVITCDLQTQIKQENTTLIHRINELEDRLRETEGRSERRSHEVSRHHQEVLAKVERRKLAELEALQARLLQVEEEGTALKATVEHLKTLAHRLTEEKEALAERLEESVCRLSEEATLGRTLTDKLRQDQQRFQHERTATHELIEELRRELEGLQLLRLETERGAALGGARRRLGSSTGLQEYQTRTREVELEQEVRRLRQERQRLQEQNEDLSGQIISTSLQGAKSLLSVPTRSRALASNPDGATHEEVVAALHEVEEINDQLRQYMDRVILAILETNPSILEIKP